MTSNELISISTDIGQAMLECGAEIYRVEDSIARICAAYGAEQINVYAVPVMISVSFSRDGEPHSEMRRIRDRVNNLGALDGLNALSRSVCADRPPYPEIAERLRLLEAHSTYPEPVLCAASCGVGLFFTLLYGGSLAEALCAAVICLPLRPVINYLRSISTNSLFINVLGGFWIALAACLFRRWGVVMQYHTTITGSIMVLVPGLLLTNAIRDLIAGDFMSGTTKFAEALVIAAGIAVGAAIPLGFLGLGG